MPETLDSGLLWGFRCIALLVLTGVPLYAARLRGTRYAMYSVVVLLLALPGSAIVHARLLEALPEPARSGVAAFFLYAVTAAGLHLGGLIRPRLRVWLFRLTISIPGQAFLAGGALSGLWLVVLLPFRLGCRFMGWESGLATLTWLEALPFAVALLSVITSMRLVNEVVRVPLGRDGPERVSRVPVKRYRRRPPAPLESRPLRIVQISDPHLGPWQSIRELRRRLRRLVAQRPDLVLLTGDFLTMEGRGSPGSLASALEPLAEAADRCLAIFGNHDHEAPEEVREALRANGVRLLIDEEAVVTTQVGPVQIVGADYVRSGHREHIGGLLSRYPRRNGHLRVLLLHDPQGFRHVPVGDVDLTLSGHTHGGQLGLVSFGLDWTVLSRTRWPDQGLFGHGSNRLYVHRGTGFYGFPLRIGVPGEASVLEVIGFDASS